MTNIREVLAANLKKYRKTRGWSQAKLAEKTGTSTQYIGMLEIKGKFPSSDMIHKLADALSIDPTELFKPEQTVRDDVSARVAKYLDDVDETFIKTIEEAVRPAVKKSIAKMRRFYLTDKE